MNKFTYALALGAGLVLGLATPTAHADSMKASAPVVQNLAPATMSAADFNKDFTATTGVLTNTYTFMNTPTTGVVESQVFQGTGNFSGLTAYAYQFGVNNVSDNSGQATSVNSASLQFNATPNPVDLGSGSNAAVYAITDGKVGQIDLPAAAKSVITLRMTSASCAVSRRISTGSRWPTGVAPRNRITQLGCRAG